MVQNLLDKIVRKYHIYGMAKLLWIFFSLFIIYGIFIPFQFRLTTEAILANVADIYWIPFVDPDGTRASISDVVQNILLFFPFGFFSFLSLTQRKIGRIALATCLGLLFSASIEILQLLTTHRITSITDLITNTTGSFCGALAASGTLLVSSKIVKWSSFRKYCQNPFLFPLLVACSIVVLGMLQPFDFMLSVSGVWGKMQSLIRSSFHMSLPLRDEGVVFLRFVLLVYVGIRFLQEDGDNHPFLKGIIMGVVLGVFLEGCQFVIRSRMPSVQDIVVLLAGSLCGGLLAVIRNAIKVPRLLWGILLFGTLFISVGIQLLSPFRLAEEYSQVNWFAFLPYYERTSFVALSNAIESVFMLFPVGFWGQYFLSRKTPRWLLPGILTFIIVVPLELGQGWIVGRYPDITDMLTAFLGTLLGIWCCSEGWTAFDRFIGRIGATPLLNCR